MQGQPLSPELISTVAGILLSLGFSYIPGLADWFNRLGEYPDGTHDGGTRKRLVMLALLLLVPAGAFGLACSGWLEAVGSNGGRPDAGLPLPACDRPGLVGLAWSFILAAMANQSAYKLTPKPARPARNPAPLEQAG